MIIIMTRGTAMTMATGMNNGHDHPHPDHGRMTHGHSHDHHHHPIRMPTIRMVPRVRWKRRKAEPVSDTGAHPDPAEIYRCSFAIIRAEADLARFDAASQDVAVRMIHACDGGNLAR